MAICTNCFSRNLRCIDCRDTADNCQYKDHKHKCMNCKSIQNNIKPQELKKIVMCQNCTEKEGFINGKLKGIDVILCDVCAYEKIKEKTFIAI